MPGDGLPPSGRAPEPVIGTLTGTAAATATATAELTTVNLSEVVKQRGVTVDEHIKLEDAKLRREMAQHVMQTFVRANLATLGALGVLVFLDQINVSSHIIGPADRIITNQVIMALLGATTIQVGAIAVIIARYLFPSHSRDG